MGVLPDGNNAVLNIYDNGSLVDSYTGVTNSTLITGGSIMLGQLHYTLNTPLLHNGDEYEFTGSMSGLTVWDRALSSAESIGDDLPTADALHNFDFADQSQPGVLINTTGAGNMQLYGDYEHNIVVNESYVISLQDQTSVEVPALVFNEGGIDDGCAMLQNAAIGMNNMSVAFSYQFSEGASFQDAFFHYATNEQRMEFSFSCNPNVGPTIKIAGIPYKPSYILNDYDEHDIVISWDGDSGVVKFYDNGALIQTFTGAYTGTLHAGGSLSVG